MAKKKVDKKAKVLITVISMFFVIMIFLCIMLYNNTKQEDILKDDIYIILNSDITSYTYDNTTKTIGDYAKVEKYIKKYIAEYSNAASEIIEIKTNKTFTSILSADNYTSDGKEFNNSINFITNTENTIDENIKKMEEMSKKKNIVKYIEKLNLSDYYVDLYKEIMLDTSVKSALEEAYNKVKASSTTIKNILTIQSDVLNLLKNNKDNWDVKDGKIVFKKSDLLAQYNDLVNKIQK